MRLLRSWTLAPRRRTKELGLYTGAGTLWSSPPWREHAGGINFSMLSGATIAAHGTPISPFASTGFSTAAGPTQTSSRSSLHIVHHASTWSRRTSRRKHTPGAVAVWLGSAMPKAACTESCKGSCAAAPAATYPYWRCSLDLRGGSERHVSQLAFSSRMPFSI
jgi:hypothetical protein